MTCLLLVVPSFQMLAATAEKETWVEALAPGFAMCLLVIGINLVGDGARERLDPRLKSRMGKR